MGGILQNRRNEDDLIVKSCPLCSHGKVFNTRRRVFSPCQKCNGKGIIAVNVLCACGEPVTTKSANGLLYCGRKECLADLKVDETEEDISDFGWQFPGYGRRFAD